MYQQQLAVLGVGDLAAADGAYVVRPPREA